MHAACLELENQLQAGGQVSRHDGSSCVEHLGSGVIVQRTTQSIDADSEASPSTITRREQRHMAHLAIQAVQALENKRKVVVVGQPGIGKTRGGLAYTLQMLLARGEGVLRVSYKTHQAHLFLPRKKGGDYAVWECSALLWSQSLLASNTDLFVLIDPPEEGPYLDSAFCYVIKYASNNQKHYHNLHKDGRLLVTSTPTEEELVAMTPELWTESSAFEWQHAETLHEQQEVVRKRAQIIGRSPRYVFSASAFMKELQATERDAHERARAWAHNPNVLLSYMLGQCTGAEGHESSVSSRLFSVEPMVLGQVEGWRRREHAEVKLKQAAKMYLREHLERSVRAYTGDNALMFEQFVQELVACGAYSCSVEPRPQFHGRPTSREETFDLMKQMMIQPDTPTYLCTSRNFPIADFVVSGGALCKHASAHGVTGSDRILQEWWNAKVVGRSRLTIGSAAFMDVMYGLELVNSVGSLVNERGSVRILLRFVCNREPPSGGQVVIADTHQDRSQGCIGDFALAKQLFEECVNVVCVDAATWQKEWLKLQGVAMERMGSLILECTLPPSARTSPHSSVGR